jgi:hypothetical protein
MLTSKDEANATLECKKVKPTFFTTKSTKKNREYPVSNRAGSYSKQVSKKHEINGFWQCAALP